MSRRHWLTMVGTAAAAEWSFTRYVRAAAPPQTHQHGTIDDPLLDHLGHEFARLYKVGRTKGVTSDNAKTLASNLRAMAAQLSLETSSLARVNPHDLLTTFQQHHEHRLKMVRDQYGVDLSDEVPAVPTPEQIAALLPTLTRPGGTRAVFEAMAARLEAGAEKIARVGEMAVQPVCTGIDFAGINVMAICYLAWADPTGGLESICALVTVATIAFSVYALIVGCAG